MVTYKYAVDPVFHIGTNKLYPLILKQSQHPNLDYHHTNTRKILYISDKSGYILIG